MEMLSSEYGWTPNQIRDINRDDIVNYLEIINTRRLIENKSYGNNKKRA